MSAKEYLHLLFTLNFINKLKLVVFLILTSIYKVTGLLLVKKFRIEVLHVEYELTIGMGELNTIIHTNLLKDYLKFDGFTPLPDSICVDIGANIGSTSLIWAKSINRGIIFAVEPHPGTFSLLERNIAINNANHKIIPRQIAIGATDGDMTLFVSEQGTMAMKPANYKWKGKEITVQSMSLDSFIQTEKISSIDILKIDIEGYEVETLEGASQTLKHTKHVVLEYHSAELRKRCIEILVQNGFESHEKGSLIFCWKN